MKILLFAENVPMDLRLLAEYYEEKGTPHWVYIFEFGASGYRKAKPENLHYGLVPPDAFVSLKDYGELTEFNKDWYVAMNRRKRFNPNKARFNKVLIRLVELNLHQYGDSIKIVDIPAGARFRVTFKDGFEVVEYENEVQWFTADKSEDD